MKEELEKIANSFMTYEEIYELLNNGDFEKALGRYTDYRHLKPMFVELDKILEL